MKAGQFGIGRRALLKAGALVPALAARPAFAALDTLALYDPAHEASRRFAEAQGRPLELDGDRVRLMRAALEARPARIVGLTKYADFLLAAEVAGEAGYRIAGREPRDGVAAPTLHSWRLDRA